MSIGAAVLVALFATFVMTEIKAAQGRAKANRALFETLLTAVPCGVAFLDRNLRYVRLNPAMAEIHGTPLRDHLGRRVREILPALAPTIEPLLTRVLETEVPLINQEVSGEVPTRPEHRRNWLISCYPLRAPRGQTTGIGVIATDITERKRAEQARVVTEAERARLQTVLDSAVNAILYVDGATGNVLANPEADRLFGHHVVAEADRSQYWRQMSFSDGRPVSVEDLPSHRALKGQTTPQEEFLIRYLDGSRVPVLESAAPIRNRAGQVIGAVVIFQDIPAIKALERLREEWTSVVAHDMRQPITTLVGYASLLQRMSERHTGSDIETNAVRHILASAQNLNRMIGDLLDVSRIEARRLRLERQVVDLPTLVQVAVERTAASISDRRVHVEVKTNIPPLDLDPGRIEQVVGNLLSNAAKYGFPKTNINVQIDCRDNDVEVSVTNRGTGIAADELPRLFTRFYRTPGAQEGKVTGLGLGLYISKGLIEAHGGRIWADSVPGGTTTFRFTLPVTKPCS